MSRTISVVSSNPDDVERILSALDGGGDEPYEVVTAVAIDASMLVVSADRAAATLAAIPAEGWTVPLIVIGDPAAARPYARDPRVSHIVRRNLPAAHLRALLGSLAAGRPLASPAAAPPHSPAEARRAQLAFTATRRLAAATDLAATEAIAIDAMVELLAADRAYCLFHDAADGSLWSESRLKSNDGVARRAVAGLAGIAARTGLPAAAIRAGDDPRWLAAVDDPTGDAASKLLVQPVAGADGAVHAVLIAARAARATPFGEAEVQILTRFAELTAPLLDQLAIHMQSQAILDDAEAGAEGAIFRREAIDAQVLPRWGDVVRVSPSWLRWANWVLVVLLIASALFVSFGKLSTYSAGPAIIRSTARTEITARSAGNVTTVSLAPGQRIDKGAVIARLDDTNQQAAVDRLDREWETQLRSHMLDLSDAAAESALGGLRLERDGARTALEERLVRSTTSGVVTDIRVRPGQLIAPGDIVAAIDAGEGGLEVFALLPGEDRPQLSPGMSLRLELAGYRYTYQSVEIESVSSDVISPNEARRVLGAEVADSLPLAGPVVVVRGRLAGTDFEVDGRTFHYHDGMLGLAEVRIRSERIIFALIPGARRL